MWITWLLQKIIKEMWKKAKITENVPNANEKSTFENSTVCCSVICNIILQILNNQKSTTCQ